MATASPMLEAGKKQAVISDRATTTASFSLLPIENFFSTVIPSLRH